MLPLSLVHPTCFVIKTNAHTLCQTTHLWGGGGFLTCAELLLSLYTVRYLSCDLEINVAGCVCVCVDRSSQQCALE